MNEGILKQIQEDAEALMTLENGRMYPDLVTRSNVAKSVNEMARLYGQRILSNTVRLMESAGK